MIRTIDLNQIHLEAGAHSPDSHFCVMELSAALAGEPWSDRPECVSPAIAAFLRAWNDALDNLARQQLKPYAARVIGTRSTAAVEQARSRLAADWLVRTYTPAWLDSAGLTDHATALRALSPLTETNARAAGDAVWAARAAAGAAARDAARDTLTPTVAILQESAFDLLDRMIAVDRPS